MEPAEAGDWLTGRPKQLVFLTGLDPANKKGHNVLAEAFSNRTPASLPLNLRLVRGELDLPSKREPTVDKGILRVDWPTKYLERVPALIVLFLDLDWDHPSWAEKKTEAESKCASVRASCRQGSRLAVVLLQERAAPTSSDDPLATERAHQLCDACQLTAKQLFVVPMLCNDLQGYVNKLETAFHELAQGFYQQKLKIIRARSIPNNTPSLVVRQLFKLAFLSELRQDTHTALRNYRLAYEQCKESYEQWEDINLFEWRSVVGLLNYKWCELCFLHSTAVEAINQMRKHQGTFFNLKNSTYPTPQLSSIEHQLWKAKQCYNFAKLFEKAVADGLTALPTLNPGSHLDLAASIYSQAHNEIAQLKKVSPPCPYPSPDPMAASTVFLGQRPWRVGYGGLATEEIERAAAVALVQRLIVNHAGVIELLSAAMTQYRRYGCGRMLLKVMNEMANVYCSSGEMAKAVQLWCLAIREGLPPLIKEDVLQRILWASYTTASVKDFIWSSLQLANKRHDIAESLVRLFGGMVPNAPYEIEISEQERIVNMWNNVLLEEHEYSLSTQKIDTCFNIEVSFLKFEAIDSCEKIPVLFRVSSTALTTICFSRIFVHFDLTGAPLHRTDGKTEMMCSLPEIVVQPESSVSYVCHLDLSQAAISNSEGLTISKVVTEIESQSRNQKVSILYDPYSAKSKKSLYGATTLKFAKRLGGIAADDGLKISCLVGEVAQANIRLRNDTSRTATRLKLEFKRNEQNSTAAAAVLFVDDANELRSEVVVNIPCPAVVESGKLITVPLRFSAQLVGDMELCLEATHIVPGEEQKRVSKISLGVTAQEPFTVTSQVLTMNGVPVLTLLNRNEHILKADVISNADIIVTRIEWLLADVVKSVGVDENTLKTVEDVLGKGDIICYCRAVTVASNEEDVETPLGRLSIEWKRSGSSSAVRSVVPLCRLPVLGCPVIVSANVDNAPAIVRQPIRIHYTMTNTTSDVLELTATFELSENYMFCGDKKLNFRLLPERSRQVVVVVMALTGGRLSFPYPSLKSPSISDSLLQQALRSLPASLFVLPRAKELNVSEA